jgi:hypothetical protein
MPKMIARKSFRYAGRSLAAGEEFAAPAADARVLAATGHATVEPAADTEIQALPRRRYRRRDMQAAS